MYFGDGRAHLQAGIDLPRVVGIELLAVTWYYTSGYRQEASTAAKAVQQRVGSYSQYDLYLAYTGIDKLTVYAKVQNLADKTPPYDASFPGIRAPYDFSQYDLRGRYFTLGFDYRF